MSISDRINTLERLNTLMEENNKIKTVGDKTLKKKLKQDYYVYICVVDNMLKYIGKGRNTRWEHCVSGRSSCALLNRDYFRGKHIKVYISKSMPENVALDMENKLLSMYPSQLYNKSVPLSGLNLQLDAYKVCPKLVYSDSYSE